MDNNATAPELDMYEAPRKWYQIWWNVWTHPGTQAFRDLIKEKNITARRAFIWVAITSFIAYLVTFIKEWRIVSYLASDVVSAGYTVGILFCTAIVMPIAAAISLAVFATIYHWIARLFKGSGTWEQLAFCFASIQAPASLFTMLLSFMGVSSSGEVQATSPSLLICVGWIVALVLTIVIWVLYISAIEAVEGLETTSALITFFVPAFVVIVLGGCLYLTLGRR